MTALWSINLASIQFVVRASLRWEAVSGYWRRLEFRVRVRVRVRVRSECEQEEVRVRVRVRGEREQEEVRIRCRQRIIAWMVYVGPRGRAGAVGGPALVAGARAKKQIY